MTSHSAGHAIPVPYTSRLLTQLHAGQTLVINGRVPTKANRFDVNLLNDCTEINPNVGNVPLHVSVRFDEGKVVLNSFLGAEWGKEERHSNPFHKDQEFDLRIRIHDDKYEISADQKQMANFNHRFAYTDIDYLQVTGDVTLTGVHWGGRYFEIPFHTQFHGGNLNHGQRVHIYGVPKGNFSVNFVGPNAEDTLFHFNPRFTEKNIVRNAQHNGDWGNEEREGGFPFKKGTGFDLTIHNEPYSIQIFLNGERIGTFAHRTPRPDRDYKSLKIDGDVEITAVEVSH